MASASAEDLRDVPPTIDGSRLVMLSGAGHVCNVELPERFNHEVRQFLAEVG
jgi:pimeloyl-ACP methyl ester carboxylesterase